MKKQLFFIIALMFALSTLKAQGYRISFTGTGAGSTVSTVEVNNLTKGTSVSLNGNDILLLGTYTAINEVKSDNNIGLKAAPNPMNDVCTFWFGTESQGQISMSLTDVSGKMILNLQDQLPAGQHSYMLSGLPCGIYLLKVSTGKRSLTSKIVCVNNPSGSGEIKHVSSIAFLKAETNRLKSSVAENVVIKMPYDEGDLLRFTGISGDYKTIIMFDHTVASSFTYSFAFVPCVDGDNNHYPIVEIGSQIWMAENLRTTRYKDKTIIPVSMSKDEWKTGFSDKYCWIRDDEAYKLPHGALYNGYAVNTEKLCPIGWHIPENGEWNTLINYLGYSDAGKKMKADIVWLDDTSVGRNASGFSAIPGGFRSGVSGSFGSDIYQSAYYWTSSPTIDGGGKLRKQLSSYFNHVQEAGSDLKGGHSVRCIKD